MTGQTIVAWPVARATFRDRGRSAMAAVLVALLMLAGASLTTPDHWGAEAFSGFGTAMFVCLNLLLGAGLLAEEIESGHAQLVLLRPLTRAAWYGGRLAGVVLAISVAVGLGWGTTVFASVARGTPVELGIRVLILPLIIVWAASWLSVLAAIGAVAPSWTNAGIVILFAAGYGMLNGLMLVIRPEWAALMQRIGHYLGPVNPVEIALSLRAGEKADWGPLAYDLVWLFGSWTVGVHLLNRRELARRRP